MNPLMRKYVWLDSKTAQKNYIQMGKMATKGNPNVSPVKLGDIVTKELGMVFDLRVGSPYINATTCEYPDLKAQYAQVLNLISLENNLQHTGPVYTKTYPWLTLLDAGSRTTLCPNHQTHDGDPNKVDIQLYTLKSTNFTQWGEPKQQIWRSDGSLDLTVFDCSRNSLWVWLMAKCFPSVLTKKKIMLHPQLIQAMVNYRIKQGQWETADLITSATQPDSTPAWNHHLHGHVEIYGECDYDFVI